MPVSVMTLNPFEDVHGFGGLAEFVTCSRLVCTGVQASQHRTETSSLPEAPYKERVISREQEDQDEASRLSI
jgi:hypothetical protein